MAVPTRRIVTAAGVDALGEVTASPAANTVLARLKALLTEVVLAAGSAIIGKVGIDQTTPGTTNAVVEASAAAILAKLDVALSTRATEVTLAKQIPIAKAAIFNTALPQAEANWLGADITPTNSPSYLQIYVCVSVAGILRIARTIGAVTLNENLNSGGALVANASYMFPVPWRTGDSINFKYSVTTGTINILRCEEVS